MLLTFSRLPGADFVINPYIGCGFGCKYCYAKFMAKFVAGKHGLSEDKKALQQQWGKWVVPKIKEVKNFENELLKMANKLAGRTILLSSVTDPYQPVEAKYKLTRKILRIWAKVAPKNANLEILTRSALILRDIDLFAKIKNLTIGMSISILPKNKFRKIEPYSPLIDVRIKTLHELKQAGLNVYAFVAPVWPSEVDKLIETLERLRKLGIPVQYIELLNKISRRQFNVDFSEEELETLQKIAGSVEAFLIQH